MMKKYLFGFICLVAVLFFPKYVYAIEDPLQNPNNPYGIHILDENDIEDAANLVNSSGGDWGYVTLVIREDEMDVPRWQKAFDTLREKHLIPIVRIATIQDEENWKAFDKQTVDVWISFLDSLHWVVKNRYIIVGNEPNHATEWGGRISPQEYAQYLVSFSQKAKDTSEDFFVLPAGLDASAPNDKSHMSEETFIQTVLNTTPDFFSAVDGWTSHSYPNPGFSGSIADKGKGSIRTYQWELALLKNKGVEKQLPVFITETGWAHDVLGEYDEYTSEDLVSDYLEYAFGSVWTQDKNVVAITPFVLNYIAKPFDVFSWKKSDGSFYEFYARIKKLTKRKGEPKQENKAVFVFTLLPEFIQRIGGNYGIAYMTNIGQSIWEDKETITQIGDKTYQIVPLNLSRKIEPFEKGLVYFREL